MNKLIKKEEVTLFEKIGYSFGDGSANLIFQTMMMFQLFFYTDVFGIKATTAGVILLLARVIDAFVDPVVGIISDRTNTRWGKYRPWVLWTIIPMGVFFVLAFTTPDWSERAKIIYAGVTYTLLMSMYSFNNTPYSSLGGVMTSDIKQRTSINSIRFVTASIATFVVQGLTLPLVAKFGDGNDQKGWLVTISIFAAVGAVLLLLTFFTTRERIEPPIDQQNSVKQDLKDIFSCVPWRAMFSVTLFLFITLSMWGSSMNYYFNYFVDKNALFEYLSKFGLVITEQSAQGGIGTSILSAFGLLAKPDLSNVFAVGFSLFNMLGQIITIVVVIFLSGFLAGIFGKKPIFIISLFGTAAMTVLFYFVSSDDISLMFWINIIRSGLYALSIPLLWAMMADVADYSEWQNKRRATGFVFAGIVFALKAGLGFGAAICGVIVDNFGFVANAVQTESALLGIRLTSSLIPAGVFALAAIILFFYPISKQVNFKIQQELAVRRAAQK